MDNDKKKALSSLAGLDIFKPEELEGVVNSISRRLLNDLSKTEPSTIKFLGWVKITYGSNLLRDYIKTYKPKKSGFNKPEAYGHLFNLLAKREEEEFHFPPGGFTIGRFTEDGCC
jgi:hypothetical protein